MLIILNSLIALVVSWLSFEAGRRLADKYRDRAETEQKEALERQYLRLHAGMDADAPCKPYVKRTIPQSLLKQMDTKLKTEGQASVLLNKDARE